MPWVAITEADVVKVLAGPELDSYRSAALEDGQADPVAPAIDAVTQEIHGYVQACARNVLGPDGTIPSRLLDCALALLAVRIPARVGRDPRPVRKDAAAAALAQLKDVAACKFMVDPPAPDLPPSTEPSSAPSPHISNTGAIAGKQRFDGL